MKYVFNFIFSVWILVMYLSMNLANHALIGISSVLLNRPKQSKEIK